MTWKLNGTRVYVEKDSGWISQARKGTIELIDTNSSILQTGGRQSYRRNLQFVVFTGYYNDIVPLEASGTITLEDDWGTVTNVSIMNMSPERLYDYLGRDIHRVKVELMEID